MKHTVTFSLLLGGACLLLGPGATAKGDKSGGSASTKKAATKVEERRAAPWPVTVARGADPDDQRKRQPTAPESRPGTEELQEQLDQLRQNITTLKKLAGEQINWYVLSGGGGLGTSTNYALVSVVGQTAVGEGSSTNYTVRHGFLQNFGAGAGGCCVGSTGNVNGDPGDVVDIADLTALIDHLFINFTPIACPAEANINGDPGGIVDIADLTALIDHLFINFTPTAPCL